MVGTRQVGEGWARKKLSWPEATKTLGTPTTCYGIDNQLASYIYTATGRWVTKGSAKSGDFAKWMLALAARWPRWGKMCALPWRRICYPCSSPTACWRISVSASTTRQMSPAPHSTVSSPTISFRYTSTTRRSHNTDERGPGCKACPSCAGQNDDNMHTFWANYGGWAMLFYLRSNELVQHEYYKLLFSRFIYF